MHSLDRHFLGFVTKIEACTLCFTPYVHENAITVIFFSLQCMFVLRDQICSAFVLLRVCHLLFRFPASIQIAVMIEKVMYCIPDW
jgi:hypothetical protein